MVNKVLSILAALAAIPASAFFVTAVNNVTPRTPSGTFVANTEEYVFQDRPPGLIVPAYFAWWRDEGKRDYDRLREAAEKLQDNSLVVVINPNSGPGPADWGYGDSVREFVNDLKSKKQIVLGYVFTSYGKRSVDNIMRDVEGYKVYGVDGYFFDEVTTDDAVREWYERIITDIDANPDLGRGYHVLNYGTYDEDTIKMATVVYPGVVISETSGERFQSREYPVWTKYHSTKTVCMLHSTARYDLGPVYFYALRNHFDYIYITERTLANNPWLNLPEYWDDLVQLVTRFQNQGQLGAVN